MRKKGVLSAIYSELTHVMVNCVFFFHFSLDVFILGQTFVRLSLVKRRAQDVLCV